MEGILCFWKQLGTFLGSNSNSFEGFLFKKLFQARWILLKDLTDLHQAGEFWQLFDDVSQDKDVLGSQKLSFLLNMWWDLVKEFFWQSGDEAWAIGWFKLVASWLLLWPSSGIQSQKSNQKWSEHFEDWNKTDQELLKNLICRGFLYSVFGFKTLFDLYAQLDCKLISIRFLLGHDPRYLFCSKANNLVLAKTFVQINRDVYMDLLLWKLNSCILINSCVFEQSGSLLCFVKQSFWWIN